MTTSLRPLALAGTLLLAACATVPSGPSVMALPGTGKTFDQFRFDDMQCRDYAQAQTGGSAQQAADNAAVRNAAVGPAGGARAGASIGGPQGARGGGRTGLVVGTAAGAKAG
ncbi:MAG: glycine zipper family protein, partial [Ignavibacteria bacterium]